MGAFFKGFSYNAVGLRCFLSEKRLWKFALIPTIINLLALILLVSLYVAWFEDLFRLLTGHLQSLDILAPQGFIAHLLDALLWLLRGMLNILFFLLSLVLVFIVVFILSQAVNSVFYEALSEKILTLKGHRDGRPTGLRQIFSATRYVLKIEGLKAVFFFSVSLTLVLLSFLPVVGIIFGLLQFFFTAWVFAFGLCTYPLILQKAPFGALLSWAWQRKLLLIGFGLPALIPFAGLFFMTVQVTGGTLLYLDEVGRDTTNAKGSQP